MCVTQQVRTWASETMHRFIVLGPPMHTPMAAHLCLHVFTKSGNKCHLQFFFSLPLFAIISPGIMTTGSVLELAGFMDIVTSGLHHIAFKFDVANVPKKMVRHLAISIIYF